MMNTNENKTNYKHGFITYTQDNDMKNYPHYTNESTGRALDYETSPYQS